MSVVRLIASQYRGDEVMVPYIPVKFLILILFIASLAPLRMPQNTVFCDGSICAGIYWTVNIAKNKTTANYNHYTVLRQSVN